jgi:hypothetical protein
MRQLIDMQVLWGKSLRNAEASLQEYGSRVGAGIPRECPFAVETFIGDDFDFDAALERLNPDKR